MTFHTLEKRERLLSLWVQDRLGEREAIEWATSAIKRIRGDLGRSTIALFEFFDRRAHESERLPTITKEVWRLLKVAALESADQPSIVDIYDVKREINQGLVRTESINRLLESVRPRLTATELSSIAKAREDIATNPLAWVRWGFATSGGSFHRLGEWLSRSELAKLSAKMLSDLVERGTASLKNSLDLARDIGWLDDQRDLPNNLVHRVFVVDDDEPNNGTAEDDEKDPDRFNNDFAPIVRLLSAAFFALAKKDPVAAQHAAEGWENLPGGLFLRLFAFASWNSEIRNGQEVASFLETMDAHPFWRWLVFPEVASLRALRWTDLSSTAKIKIGDLLMKGPDKRAFRTNDDVPEETILFHRDHELARLVDAGSAVPEEFRRLVKARRDADATFPRSIPPVEIGRPGARAYWVPDGTPDRFDGVPTGDLLRALVEAHTQREFGRGDDAEAFARTTTGKNRILDALSGAPPDDEILEEVWRLLLSYPPDKKEDASIARELADRIAGLALALPDSLIARLADRLCYWLNQTDEQVPGFVDADRLWHILLPYAVDCANDPEHLAEHAQDEDADIDLTMAALNEPLGHLLSFFLRRCPAIPAHGSTPSLPSSFVLPLKELKGRALEILANRVVVHISYFARADIEWLEKIALTPMTHQTRESDRIWEAFAKYGQVPNPDIWQRLQHFIFQRLASSHLSPEARRHLAEMSVIAWVWSMNKKSRFMINATAFRSALGLANDDVRAAAAWRFLTFFTPAKETDRSQEIDTQDLWPRIGPPFFQEVWPLEPALQSATTANHFAGLPARTGIRHFASAVMTILPYLQPFEVWAVAMEFGLNGDDPMTGEVVRMHPEETLALLASCIAHEQRHGVFGLNKILDHIIGSRSDLQRDHRMRRLRRLAKD